MPIVKLYANLRLVAGLREIVIPGESLGELLTELVRRVPVLNDHLFEEGQLRRHVIITLNGQNISDLDTPIIEEDQIAIFPPIAGG